MLYCRLSHPFKHCGLTDDSDGYVITLKCEDLRIQRVYSIIYGIFMERILQYTGRICSKDDAVSLIRRLWLPEPWKDALFQTIRFYAEVAALFQRHPDSEFRSLLKIVHCGLLMLMLIHQVYTVTV